MTRKRVMSMQRISHEPTRLATFKKRKACILKKARELSILCAVPVCVVVSDGTNNATPEIWPESAQAGAILARFSSLSEAEQTKKMVDKNGFISQQIAKKMLQVEKINPENQELEAQLLLNNILAGDASITDVRDVETIARIRRIVETQNRESNKRKEEQRSVSQPVPVESGVSCGTSCVQNIVPVLDEIPLDIDEFFDFEGFSADLAVQQGSVYVSYNEKISESSSDVAESNDELMRLIEEFGDFSEMDWSLLNN